jgi:hypothetical protein
MTAASNQGVLDLTASEAWVVHAAVLAHVERELEHGSTPTAAIDLLHAVEADTDDFSQSQLQLLVDVLSTYLDDAPPADREPGRRALASVRSVLA